MLEDAWHAELPRRSDFSESSLFGTYNSNQIVYNDNNFFYRFRIKEQENLGLADAITRSILSAGMTVFVIFKVTQKELLMCYGFAGRLELQRKLFSSIQLVS